MMMIALLGTTLAVAQTSQPATSQQSFPTPQSAADALVDACKNNDSAALVRLLGPRYGAQLEKIDDAEERQHRQELYEQAHLRLEIEQSGENKAVIVIGRKRWPVPIPLVKEAAGWRFDTDAGLAELQARRIGRNELVALAVCEEHPRLQVQYAAIDRDGDAVREFAPRIMSSAGKRDGLYWEWDPDTDERPSPLQTLLPDYYGDLTQSEPGTPFMGYHFKILTRQGANPPGGKYDYIINGNMIAGFALVAWPADHRASGVMTFVISHQGKLFEKDLGPDTAKRVEAMTEYDPDDTWQVAEP